MSNPLQGQQLNAEEQKIFEQTAQHWQKVWNETPVQALGRIEDAAKQMIAVTTGLQGLYAAVVAFSSIRGQIITVPAGVMGWLVLLLFLLPFLCWLVSLRYATRVFVPHVQADVNFNEVSTTAWQKVKEGYGHAGEEKLRQLQRSHRWLVISFIFLFLAIVVFVALPTAPTK